MTESRRPTLPQRRLSAADLARVVSVTGLIAILGLPGSFSLFGNAVPINLQSMGALLAGALLGGRRGVLAVATFLVLVAAGFPLLAGGRGGLGVFVGPSAGYLAGYLVAAAVVGWLVQRSPGRPRLAWLVPACLSGSAVILAIGIPVQAFITDVPLATTAALAAVFVPGDIAKAVFTAMVALGVHRAYPQPSFQAHRSRTESATGD